MGLLTGGEWNSQCPGQSICQEWTLVRQLQNEHFKQVQRSVRVRVLFCQRSEVPGILVLLAGAPLWSRRIELVLDFLSESHTQCHIMCQGLR